MIDIKGSKYLSEVIDVTSFSKGKLNIIKAPTGSGKTYFAITCLPQTLNDPRHEVVYLIDTVNGLEQIIKNYPASKYTRQWHEVMDDEVLCFDDDRKVVVMTYAKFGALLEREPDFYQCFEYIICDELHSLMQFEHYTAQPNVHSIAHKGLIKAVNEGLSTVVALTATPDRVVNYFNAPHKIIPIDEDEVYHYDVLERITYHCLDDVIENIDSSKTGILYLTRITAMKQIQDESIKRGINAISIWSIRNNDYPMSEEQLRVRNQILYQYTIPDPYNLLIINSSSETSIKIKSHVDYVIVHDGNNDTQIQVRGRVNSDLETLYVPWTKEDEIIIPDEYLSRRLFTDDKRALCEYLNHRNKSGRLFRWPTIKDMIIDSGYAIEEGRAGNNRYAVITTQE